MKKRLDRRSFLKTTALGTAGLTVVAGAEKPTFAMINQAIANDTRIIPLNHRWLYSEKFSPEAVQPNFNDKNFERVNIPHTNKMLPAAGFDERDYMFVSVYRRRFRLPKELRGKRVFIDFGGVMTASKVYLNGKMLGEYLGGYTPFSFELTKELKWDGENVLAVEVDSTERKDIPPFGREVDYLTFGGIYRDVNLRFTGDTYIDNVFARGVDVTSEKRRLDVTVFLSEIADATSPLEITVELFDGDRSIEKQDRKLLFPTNQPNIFSLDKLSGIKLWDIDNPNLYRVRVELFNNGKLFDRFETRVGFREAKFTADGFFLNGKPLKLRGLNRHQTFPYIGQAAPARLQKRDAWILRKDMKCNMVRTSHYPQSPHFLDACDEYGLLVLEEIPGWQHIGDKAWQDLSVGYVESMVKRDWNHPSVVLWGVRINESGDNTEFYTRTNKVARNLDDSRQTGGIRNKYDSEKLEDVFTMNEFRFPLRPPRHPQYLITEFNGHMYPTKRYDNVERIREHTHRHARVHDEIASNVQYAGGLGWCAFDYNTHDYFGSGDRICYHGVADIFRIPKPAAGFYRSQCSPTDEIVLEPAFDWARGDENETFTRALVSSNCEMLKFFLGDELVTEIEPDRQTYPHLKYAPFAAELKDAINKKGWNDLRIEGYIGGRKVIERKMSGKGIAKYFIANADDAEISADGIDMTRVVFKVTDEFGNVQPFATGAIQISVENGEIIGDNPFPLIGGGGAVWIRSTEKAGIIRATFRHPRLGSKTVEIKSAPATIPAL